MSPCSPNLSILMAALPVMVETVSNKILEHITEQCLICCDVGVPCGARQACNDPSALIFPFQVGFCTIYHKLILHDFTVFRSMRLKMSTV